MFNNCSFGSTAPPGLSHFTISFPNVTLNDVTSKYSNDQAKLYEEAEKTLQTELNDASLRILLIADGCMDINCLTLQLREDLQMCVKNDLKSRALGEVQPYYVALPIGPSGNMLEYQNPSILSRAIAILGLAPEPVHKSLPSVQGPHLLASSSTDSVSKNRIQVAAQVELLLDKCVLGKPCRTDDEGTYDDAGNEIPAVTLYWYPRVNDKEKKCFGIIISDSETRIICPGMGDDISIHNDAVNFAYMLESSLKDFLPPTKPH
jgi:hypothetical protein